MIIQHLFGKKNVIHITRRNKFCKSYYEIHLKRHYKLLVMLLCLTCELHEKRCKEKPSYIFQYPSLVNIVLTQTVLYLKLIESESIVRKSSQMHK